jgi:hypothetical protein
VIPHAAVGWGAILAGAFGLWWSFLNGWPMRLPEASEGRVRLFGAWLIGIAIGGMLAGPFGKDLVIRGTSVPLAWMGYAIIVGGIFCIWLFVFRAWPLRWR